MDADEDHRTAVRTVIEVRALQSLARADGLTFCAPLLFYGGAALISGVLMAWAPYGTYATWWLLVAIAGLVLIPWCYRRRLQRRGIGISPWRVLRYVALAEAVAAAVWLQPFVHAGFNLCWLAMAVALAVAGRAWRMPSLVLLGLSIAVAVAAGGLLGHSVAWSTQPATDAVIGLTLLGFIPVVSRDAGLVVPAGSLPASVPR